MPTSMSSVARRAPLVLTGPSRSAAGPAGPADGADGTGTTAPELTQAQVEDETDTTFGTVSGERLSQAVAEFESAGGGTSTALPDFFDAPIEEVAAINVSDVTPENYLAIDANNVITNRGGFTIEVGTNTHQAIKVSVDGNYTIAAVTGILQNNAGVPRNRTRFQFAIVRAGVDVPAAGSGLYASYGRATVPAGFADGSYSVDLLADDEIEIRYSDELATTATYTLGGGLSRISVLRNEAGGGGLTTSEQESLSNARTLTSRVFNGAGNGIATLGSGATTWPTNSPNTFVVTATEYADIERIELVFRQNGKVGLPYIITKGVLDEIPAGAFMPNSPADTQTIRGVFYAGRIGPGHRNTNYWVINPRFDFMEERREASDNCILIQYGLNGTLFTGVFIRARQPSGGLIFQHAELFYWVDA